jgi:hypothetical protein
MNDTWEDVERAALNDPVLHAMLTYVRQGISRERALIWAVLALSEQAAALSAAKLDAAIYGNGFVTVARTPDGTFSARKLEPTSVVIHQKPPQEKKR